MLSKLNKAGQIAASGLKSSRTWMNVISNNLANIHSVDTGKRSADGNLIPYARQVPVFAKVLSESYRRNEVNKDPKNGVAVKGIATLKDSVKKVYDPTHPAARKAGTVDAGYVYYPKVSLAQELADLRLAAASYEANLAVMSVGGRIRDQSLLIGRRG